MKLWLRIDEQLLSKDLLARRRTLSSQHPTLSYVLDISEQKKII